jgi:ribokinase
MGAGYAKALGGTLLHALGDAGDPKSRAVESLLRAEGIHFRPIRIPGATADWSLLISSGPHGDKLPIGFRGCHAAIELAALTQAIEAISHQVRIVASFPNSLAATALAARGTAWRVFAPAARNMIDRACPIQSFAASIDLLVGNRTEWRMLPANEREVIDEALSLRFETDGPNGFRLRIRDSTGRSVLHEEAAFPRKRPPRDTNRAGEACAASLIRTLATAGWFPGIFPSSDLIRVAARRASAAAGLILDFEQFGFPTEDQIEHAIEEGVIP